MTFGKEMEPDERQEKKRINALEATLALADFLDACDQPHWIPKIRSIAEALEAGSIEDALAKNDALRCGGMGSFLDTCIQDPDGNVRDEAQTRFIILCNAQSKTMKNLKAYQHHRIDSPLVDLEAAQSPPKRKGIFGFLRRPK